MERDVWDEADKKHERPPGVERDNKTWKVNHRLYTETDMKDHDWKILYTKSEPRTNELTQGNCGRYNDWCFIAIFVHMVG